MKTRNSILTINLDIISKNIDVLQSYSKPDMQHMAVVKARAYGHGAVKVALKIASKIDWFAVNNIEEGIELREHDIQNPILVFGVPEAGTAALYKQYNLTATISAWKHFELLPDGTAYHLNMDTGMGRLGFRPEQWDEVLIQLKKNKHLQCIGIYSHFATADEPDSPKIDDQIEMFNEIRSHFPSSLLAHMGNTAGSIQPANAPFDMVRIGIGLYGYEPGNVSIPALKPAVSWRTHLVQIKEIKKGETVSYGAIWSAPEDGYTGVIPVGYADGIPRRLSGNFEVIIEGERYPVVGRVTMNYCIIYLGKTKFETGKKVFLWNDHISPRHWADALETISYEVITQIPDHVPRTYLHG